MTESITHQSAEARLVAEHRAMLGAALNGSNAFLHERRRSAVEEFERLGFPAPKDESYKYTRIGRLFQGEYAVDADAPPISQSQIDALEVPDLDAHRLVVVNGHFQPEHSRIGSLPPGVIAGGLQDASASHPDVLNRFVSKFTATDADPFEALNTAFVRDGIFIFVPRGKTVEKPFHILNLVSVKSPTLVQPRVVVAAESGAAVSVIESSVAVDSVSPTLNAVSELYADTDAFVDYYRLQLDHKAGTVVTTTNVYQQSTSNARTTTITLGGRVVRNNLRFLPDGEHCETHLMGLVVANGSMHVDNHTSVDHARPNCVSNELYKNILADQSTGVFNGRVLVRQDSQKTQAYQSNRAVVLSDDARMYSKPELEIYADDVMCSHGAATGRIDPESIFYLRSRGLSLEDARKMMLQAFCRDVTDSIRVAPLREYVDQLVRQRL